MSKLVIFSIRDNVAEIFNKPFTDLNIASAMRSFKLSLKDEPQKADYTLYKIAELDQTTGQVTSNKEPVLVMTGFEVISEDIDKEERNPPHLVDQAI